MFILYHKNHNFTIMRLPYRKPGKYMTQKPDPTMTQDKFVELQNKLNKLLAARPKAAADVTRLAELGDFSENVEYQLAKGRLRAINGKILEIEYTLKNAEIIRPNANKNTVQLGHTVTVENGGQSKIFQILGSSETNPTKNIISQNSPLGSALLGRRVRDKIKLELKDRTVEYKIIKIE